MCRNIHTLYNFEPPATQDEIEAAARQFVRKVSGFQKPSKANQAAMDRATVEIAAVIQELLQGLTTSASPRDRAAEAARAHERSIERFGR